MVVSSPQVIISTWFYAEGEQEESFYPQVGGKPSSGIFQDVYLRSVANFFASSHRNNPAARHILFTNSENSLELTSGFSISGFIRSLGVEVIVLPMTYATPIGYYHSWRNQFYVFDVLQRAARIIADQDVFLLLDSDCVFISGCSEMVKEVARLGVLTYDVGFAEEDYVSGYTIRQMREVFKEIDSNSDFSKAVYSGGEIVAATGQLLRQLSEEFGDLWPVLLARHVAGETKLNEEAQCLSFIYTRMGVGTGSANRFIKRIWTCLPPKPVTADESDFGLSIWHVPAEKRYGLRRLFASVKNTDSEFWSTPTGPSLAKYMGDFLGVPRRTPVKAALDLKDGVLHLARKHAQRIRVREAARRSS